MSCPNDNEPVEDEVEPEDVECFCEALELGVCWWFVVGGWLACYWMDSKLVFTESVDPFGYVDMRFCQLCPRDTGDS